MILAVAVTFPMLAAWQFDRWQEVRDEQERIEQRVEAAPVPIDQVLPHDLDDRDAADLEFQPVTATGTWVIEEQVAQRNRALQGRAGFDWLTPLALGDGTAILVRRGFVPPVRPGSADPAPGAAQAGTVTVTGWLERSVTQPRFGARDPDDGVLSTVFHPDVDRIDQQTSAALLPMVLHLVTESPPPPDDAPTPQPVPARDVGQHLSYAIQWLSFTAIALIGYAVVLRRMLRRVPDPVAG
jgi:cytochrome oxidase assembly protein ShyY1